MRIVLLLRSTLGDYFRTTSVIFLTAILATVVYLTLTHI